MTEKLVLRKASDLTFTNCVWPEPAWNGGGIWWEEDDVDPMLLDEDGRELLEIKEYFDTLVEEGRLNGKRLNIGWMDN